MTRINVYNYGDDDGEDCLAGWFNANTATRWTDADHNGNGSGGVGRGQAVYRTAGGKWVLENWTAWQNEAHTHYFITPAAAQTWLLRNHEDAAVAQYFGLLAEEEDRRPGRPEIGGIVQVRLGDELFNRLDHLARERDSSRAETIREILRVALA